MREAIEAGTPLIRLERLIPGGRLHLKAEFMLPSGGAFDRVSAALIEASTWPGTESSSPLVVGAAGSVCLSFAAAAARIGRDLIVVCPASTLKEHRVLLADYPCEVVESPAQGGLHGAAAKAEAVAAERGGVVLFSARSADRARSLFASTLGAELAKDLERIGGPPPSVIVAPVGSGALLRGVVDAFDGPFAPVALGTIARDSESGQDGAVRGDHETVAGMRVIPVGDEAAFDMRTRVARQEGLLVGLATAGALSAAEQELRNDNIRSTVVIGVDAGDRYFSRDAEFARKHANP